MVFDDDTGRTWELGLGFPEDDGTMLVVFTSGSECRVVRTADFRWDDGTVVERWFRESRPR